MKKTKQLLLLATGLLLSGGIVFAQGNEDQRYNESELRQLYDRAYDKGYDKGFKDGQKNGGEDDDQEKNRKSYKYFTFGLYGGANSTRFEGEDVDGKNLTGRLGYQLGFFLRGGGRVFGQIGAEYLTSSSDFYKPGDGTTVKDIRSSIDQQYVHVPAYLGVKLVQSRRGISAVRLQVGAEYAFPVGVNTNQFDLQQSDFNSATVNGLVGLGFDIGPLLIGAVYHHGFVDVLKDTEASKRRIVGVNVGFKF